MQPDAPLATLLAPVRSLVYAQTSVRPGSIHGPDHWWRVQTNGLEIAEVTGADRLVVALFALFHDCMRRSDGRDPEHGPRAAAFIRRQADALRFVDEAQMALLLHACEHHTHEILNADVTIGACYDADRLELPRVGIIPDPRKLNTEYARALAKR